MKESILELSAPLKDRFFEEGYLIVDLEYEDDFYDDIVKSMKKMALNSSTKKNPSYFQYNESPRIVEAWKEDENIKQLCRDNTILKLLKFLYGKKPIPFSTINFIASSEQPLHSDEIHFGSIPASYLCGVWIALEDIQADSGPLEIVPQSHKLDRVCLRDLGLKTPKSNKQIKENYTVYEEYIRNQVEQKGLSRQSMLLKKGQALIWDSNLLHGGTFRENKKSTRLAQVIHYHFEGCKYFNPQFSDLKNEVYIYRDIEEII